jgi:hypothetical protein
MDAMEAAGSSETSALRDLFGRRGWTFSSMGSALAAHRVEWPAQLNVVVDPGGPGGSPIMGLVVDLRSMPLRGERFRDVFNSEREQLMRGMGSFRVRQRRGELDWTEGITDGAFLRGVDGGISRHDDVVLFDRCPDISGDSLATRFGVESTRLVETGNEIASVLQRIYNRTVLRGDLPIADLPDQVVPSVSPASPPPAVVGEPSYPWRR